MVPGGWVVCVACAVPPLSGGGRRGKRQQCDTELCMTGEQRRVPGGLEAVTGAALLA